MRIHKDLKRYSEGSFLKGLYTILLNSNFQMLLWYRIAHWCFKHRLWIFSKFIMYFHKIIFSVDIDYRCTIGGGCKILHGLAIVIGKDVVIGENATIYKGVVLGGNTQKKRMVNGREIVQPVIGSNVQIYSDCAVLGPCVIGDGCEIGAHTVVTHDVPAGVRIYTKTEKIMVSRECGDI